MNKNTISTLLLCLIATLALAQTKLVTLSGKVQEATSKAPIAYVSVALKTGIDSQFVVGTITNEAGLFTFNSIKSGKYYLEASFLGYQTTRQNILVGQLTDFLDLGIVQMSETAQAIGEVVVSAKQAEIASLMDKKTFNVADNVSQSGGSVLQSLSNLPGITVTESGKVQLRGSDKVAVMIDGRQTALTGFDSQKGLDNIPASAIERIEIINNPSSKYDANGNAGIINIVFKKNIQEGFHGQFGLAIGAGALWEKKENLPSVRPQFSKTPKWNPSISLNYRKKKANVYVQGDWLHTKTLNKNEFSTRAYETGSSIIQQVRRNRTTSYATAKTGLDYYFNAQNTFTISGLFNREKIDDLGDNPYFLNDFSNRYRLWQFVEDEVKYTASATLNFAHKFREPGHTMQLNGSYYFHREDEKYNFTNILPTFTGYDAFKLLSDEHVFDVSLDYTKPLRQGRFETGLKCRRRTIPINMQFFPGLNSPIDSNAGGWAKYKETIPAVYGNYVFESDKIALEGGLRIEYVRVDNAVNPDHNTYKSDGYGYFQPFPNMRLTYKINDYHKFSLFYNRRVDRPNEVDIRIFPKYDEPELIKVGNPALKPQFTNSFELGYKYIMPQGSLYTAVYHRLTNGTITRIATQTPNSVLLYNVFQNAGRSHNTGLEVVFQQKINKKLDFSLNSNVYQNVINAFSVTNQYPLPTPYTSDAQEAVSGNVKLISTLHLAKEIETQISAVYLAPDIVPQGKVSSRYSIDLGIKKQVLKGRGNVFLNMTDIFNTMRLKREIMGTAFTLLSTDYYETQVFRVGYNQKF